MHPKSDGDGMTGEAAEGEGRHEGAAAHFEGSGCQDKGTEGHGRRQNGGQGHCEDCMIFHPGGDALEDAWWNAFLKERHASGLPDQIAEESTKSRPGACENKEQREVGPAAALGRYDDNHDVGEAGDGQGNKRGIDDGDDEDPEEAKREKQMKQGGGVGAEEVA